MTGLQNYMMLMNMSLMPFPLLKYVPDSVKLQSIGILGKEFIEHGMKDYTQHPESVKGKIKNVLHVALNEVLGEAKDVLKNRETIAKKEVESLSGYNDVSPDVVGKVKTCFKKFFPDEHESVTNEFVNRFKAIAQKTSRKLANYNMKGLKEHLIKKLDDKLYERVLF